MSSDYKEYTEYKGYNIVIEPDECNESPRENDNLGHMACFHDRYNLGDEYTDRPDRVRDPADFNQWFDENEKDIAIILPLYLYDHSGITMWTDDGVQRYHQHYAWDGGQVGYIYVLKSELRNEYHVKHVTKKILDLARKVLIGEVQEYDQFLTGDVWGYNIYAPNDEDQEESLDSCWGFYGSDYCLEQAKEIVDSLALKDEESAWNKIVVEEPVQ